MGLERLADRLFYPERFKAGQTLARFRRLEDVPDDYRLLKTYSDHLAAVSLDDLVTGAVVVAYSERTDWEPESPKVAIIRADQQSYQMPYTDRVGDTGQINVNLDGGSQLVIGRISAYVDKHTPEKYVTFVIGKVKIYIPKEDDSRRNGLQPVPVRVAGDPFLRRHP